MRLLSQLGLVFPSMLLGMSLTSGLIRLDNSNLGTSSASFYFMLATLWGIIVLLKLYTDSREV